MNGVNACEREHVKNNLYHTTAFTLQGLLQRSHALQTPQHSVAFARASPTTVTR